MGLTQYDIKIVDLTEIVGDIEIPCQFSRRPDENLCPDLPARWIMWLKPCCPDTTGAVLACDPCKEWRLMDQGSVECPHCGHVEPHAPDAYTYIEPINKRTR